MCCIVDFFDHVHTLLSLGNASRSFGSHDCLCRQCSYDNCCRGICYGQRDCSIYCPGCTTQCVKFLFCCFDVVTSSQESSLCCPGMDFTNCCRATQPHCLPCGPYRYARLQSRRSTGDTQLSTCQYILKKISRFFLYLFAPLIFGLLNVIMLTFTCVCMFVLSFWVPIKHSAPWIFHPGLLLM